MRLEASFCYLGFAVLIGYNVILTEMKPLGTLIGSLYMEWVVIAYSCAVNIALFGNIFLGHKWTDQTKALIGVGFASASLCLLPVLALYTNQRMAVWLCLTAVFSYGIAGALLQGTLQGLASRIEGGRFLQYFFLGFGFSGLIGYPLFLAVGKENTRANVSFLLYTSAVFTLAGGPVYCYIARQLTQPVLKLQEKPEPRSISTTHSDVESKDLQQDPQSVKGVEASVLSNFSTVAEQIRLHAITLFFSCFVTFVVFPREVIGWSKARPYIEQDNYAALIIYVYQIADVIARLIIGYLPVPSCRSIFISSIVRAALIPVCVACRIQGWFLYHAVTHSIVMAVLAFSLGLIMTWIFMITPKIVSKDQDKVMVGYILSFAVVFGIFSGVLFGERVFEGLTSAYRSAAPA